jgi:hypothetical protein
MRAKAAGVKDRVRERTQRRATGPRVESPIQKAYRVVAISLYSEQAKFVDRATQDLIDAGYRRPSRSLVIQAAIERLQEDLTEKSREEIARYFRERYARRPPAIMPSRERPQQLRLFQA